MSKSFIYFHGFVFLCGYAALAEEPTKSVDDVAREFRVSTYEEFRKDRSRFDERMVPAVELLDKWHAADMPASHEQVVRDWFADAQSGVISPLPELPEAVEIVTDESSDANPFTVSTGTATDTQQKPTSSIFSSMRRAFFGGPKNDPEETFKKINKDLKVQNDGADRARQDFQDLKDRINSGEFDPASN